MTCTTIPTYTWELRTNRQLTVDAFEKLSYLQQVLSLNCNQQLLQEQWRLKTKTQLHESGFGDQTNKVTRCKHIKRFTKHFLGTLLLC